MIGLRVLSSLLEWHHGLLLGWLWLLLLHLGLHLLWLLRHLLQWRRAIHTDWGHVRGAMGCGLRCWRFAHHGQPHGNLVIVFLDELIFPDNLLFQFSTVLWWE